MIEGSVAGTLVRLVLSLATVLMLMVVLARYLRHRQLGTGFGAGFGAGATRRRKKALPLEIVTRQGLSRGSSLAVVRVSGQLLLLGVTETSVSVLRELEDVDEPEVVAEFVGAPAPALGSRDFAASLVETLRQWTVRHG